jgi:hypothetical protein
MHAILPTDELRPRSKADEVRLQDEGTHTSRTIMLDELPAVLASCRPGAGVDAKRQVNELRQLKAIRAETAKKLDEMGRASSESWNSAKQAFADSYKDLQKAYDDAIAKVRK